MIHSVPMVVECPIAALFFTLSVQKAQTWIACVSVLHIKPFVLPVDIQHTQCPRCFILAREIPVVQLMW